VEKTEKLLQDSSGCFSFIQSIFAQSRAFQTMVAKVGYERNAGNSGSGSGIDRARENGKKLGRSEKWNSATNDGSGDPQ
jgi:hypothetical protein